MRAFNTLLCVDSQALSELWSLIGSRSSEPLTLSSVGAMSFPASSSSAMLSALVLRDRDVTAVIESVVYYSIFDWRYFVFPHKACVSDIAKDPISSELSRGAIESGSRCSVRSTKLVRRFSEALRLVDKLNDKAAGKSSSAIRGVLGTPHFDNAVFSSTDEHDALLYTEAVAALTRDRKQHAIFSVRAFYPYAALLRGVKDLHSLACEKRLFSSDDTFISKIFLTKTSLLSVEKMFQSALIHFF